LNGIEYKSLEATIRHTSQLRIGNDFFKDYIIYIDNLNSNYSLKKINQIKYCLQYLTTSFNVLSENFSEREKG